MEDQNNTSDNPSPALSPSTTPGERPQESFARSVAQEEWDKIDNRVGRWSQRAGFR